jgi:hypothetical protein
MRGIYLVFPEERGSDDMFSDLDEHYKKTGGLYIHRDGFHDFANSINNERVLFINTFKTENPEIYDVIADATGIIGDVPEEIFQGRASDRQYRADIMVFVEIMKSFDQIVETIAMLQDGQSYLKELPSPEKNTISRYIRYHISNHFNEFFIVLERLNALLRTIQRIYRKDPRFHEFRDHFLDLRSIPDDFKKLRQNRNYHVHQERYTDPALHKLETLEFSRLYELGDKQSIDSKYIEVSKQYHDWLLDMVNGTINSLEEMLNLFFGILGRFLFDQEGKFMPPREFRKKH